MGGESTVESIDAVDVFARNLYLRLKQSPNSGNDPPLDDVALAVRQLHLALRHLRVEAADPDSLLNRTAETSLYVRQLAPLVEDCGFQLRQLDTALATIDIYGDGEDSGNRGSRADRLANLRAKLANEKTNIDMFLDTIQLHNPAKQPAGIVDGSQLGLENIKDKVDAIAGRLCTKYDGNGLGEDEESRWQEFKSELEKEGFSPQVLRRHKEVLRAYIRELETMSQQNGGKPPTVRGLLEHEAKFMPASNKELMFPAIENEKYFPSMRDERRMPDSAPLAHLPPPPRSSQELEPRRSLSSESGSSDVSDSMAMISTKDLLSRDQLAAGMANMHLHPQANQYYGTSPATNQKYLTSGVAGMLPAPGEVAELAGSPNSMALSASPRSNHTLPAYSSPQVPPYASPRTTVAARLAPDQYGKDIPMEAQWTIIRRALVSLEVLDRAGERYEARPEYVAVLGRLSREQIAEYARRSADTRAAREGRYDQSKLKHDRQYRDRSDSKSSQDEKDDESVLWDESDTTDFDDDKTSDKGTKSYPYIVSFPEKDKEKTSPSSTSQPKSILKNKNENHVRFDPEPYEVGSRSSRSPPKEDRERRSSRRYHGDDRHYRESGSDHRRHNGESGRSSRRSVDQGGSDRSDRHYRSSRRSDRRDRDRYRERDRDRDDEASRRDDKSSKKKAWGETLGAVGIGGAAVSLLGVLAEAATG